MKSRPTSDRVETIFLRLLRDLRQLAVPAEFRIEAPAWPPDLLAGLEQLAQSLSPAPATQPPAGSPQEGIHGRALADVGTGLWRLRQKMVQPGTDRPLEGMDRACRHLESVWDALARAGIQIRDHTGERVPEGGIYALSVIAFQPTSGISRSRVIETIRPTIYCRDEMIQMGEVIVATPETPVDRKQASAAKDPTNPGP